MQRKLSTDAIARNYIAVSDCFNLSRKVTMPDLVLNLSAALPVSRLAQITREMSRDLSRAGISAKPVTAPVAPGERGDAVTLAEIALGLVTSGAVTALLECLKAYITRERSLSIKLNHPDGTLLEITSKNVDTAAVQEALRKATAPKPG